MRRRHEIQNRLYDERQLHLATTVQRYCRGMNGRKHYGRLRADYLDEVRLAMAATRIQASVRSRLGTCSKFRTEILPCRRSHAVFGTQHTQRDVFAHLRVPDVALRRDGARRSGAIWLLAVWPRCGRSGSSTCSRPRRTSARRGSASR